MAVKGMSFYYEESKCDLLKEEANKEGRTLSGYIQIVLQKELEGTSPVPLAVKKPTIKKSIKKFKRRIKK